MMHLNIVSVRTASILLVSALMAGCGSNSSKPKLVSPSSRPISMVTPVEFFSPDQKRLGQHLNWNVGCFKVDYSGPTDLIQSRLVVWQDGKPQGNGGSLSMSAGNGEISISVRDTPGSPGMFQVTQVLSSTGSSSSTTGGHQRPKFDGWATNIAKIDRPLDLVPGRETAVWALIIRKSGRADTAGSSITVADQAQHSDWALVLNVSLGRGK